MIFLLLAGMAAKAGVSAKVVALGSKLIPVTAKAVHMAAAPNLHAASHMLKVSEVGTKSLMNFVNKGPHLHRAHAAVAGLMTAGSVGAAVFELTAHQK